MNTRHFLAKTSFLFVIACLMTATVGRASHYSAKSETIWQKYTFTIDNCGNLPSQFSTLVMDKLATLNLQDATSSAVMYEVTSNQPLIIDIYVERYVDEDDVETLLGVQNILIYSDDTASNDAEVKAITNKGAVKEPPPTSNPII